MKERENVLRILKETRKAIKEDNPAEIKELSNQTTNTASLTQDPDNIAVAVIVYSIGKILERDNYKSMKGWNTFYRIVITSLDKAEAEIDDHFFKVILNNVTKEELLDKNSVKNYLSMVAPVPFSSSFSFSDKIHAYFNKINVKIKEYDISLNINDEKLQKAYKLDILKKQGLLSPG